MKECGLSQRAFAEVIEASLDRVKSITSGRVKNLTHEESAALIKKLHVRGDWLVTGEGPMFQAGMSKQFTELLAIVKSASETAGSLPLPPEQRRLVQEILFYLQAGKSVALVDLLERFTALTPDEAALLDNYRNTAEEKRSAIREVGAALAQPRAVKKGRAA